MIRDIGASLVVVLVGVLIPPAAIADEANWMEIDIRKHVGGYDIDAEARKLGATTCSLSVPSGAYELNPFDNGVYSGFRIENHFGGQYQDMSFAQVGTAIGSDWVMTWDEGLPTQTVATIRIGTVEEDEWDSLPTITNPLPGAVDVSPNTSIEWTHDGPAVDGHCASVEQMGGALWYDCDEFASNDVTTWTPPAGLVGGTWLAKVIYFNSVRFVSDGIGGSIVGDPWVLENEDWLSLTAEDYSQFTVVPEPATLSLLALGSLVALRRRRR